MKSEILKEFLNVYWLRPETAVWRAIDVVVMDDFSFLSPSLDLGCGDGIFSFLRGGGRFDLTFDVYSDVNVSTSTYFKNVDVYDHYNHATNVKLTRNPFYKIDFALDHKNNLLEKAKRFNFYNNYLCHDANTSLPFPDSYFNTIFSNIVYWLDKPKNALLEINRILKSKGKVALMLPDESFINCSLYSKLYMSATNMEKITPLPPPNNDWKWLEKIDRGRMTENIKHLYNAAKWEDMFFEANLKVVKHKKHLSRNFISMWDIGLRPIFPLLYKMQNKLKFEDKLEIKKEWVSLFHEFALPIMEIDLKKEEKDCVFHYYVLEKI